MNWQDIMNTILPPVYDVDRDITIYPHITDGGRGTQIHDFWEMRHERGKWVWHGGTDINYIGGQNELLNQINPEVHSPIEGTVTEFNTAWGRIVITDSDGLRHEFYHLVVDSWLPLAIGNTVHINDVIGEMGDTHSPGQVHVHYQIISDGNPVDPVSFWDMQDPVTPISIPFGSFNNPVEFGDDLYYEAMFVPPPRPPSCPIILDLDGDGVETIGLNNGAYFDHDCNGFAEQTGWAAYEDGLLVRDINGDGIVNDGKELFGDHALLQNGSNASDGFQAPGL